MLPTIQNARPLPGACVEIHWADGSVSVIPFNDVIAKGGLFSQLADPEFFAKVEVGDYGDCITWPGELDLGADSLWYRAHPDAPIEELEVVKV